MTDETLKSMMVGEKNKYTFLVTGATGFIGGELIETILSCQCFVDYEIIVIGLVRSMDKARVKFSNYLSNPQLIFYEWNMRLPCVIEEDIDYIFHTAADTCTSHFLTHPIEIITNNMTSCENILNLALEKKAKRTIIFSTSLVYGNMLNHGKISEGELGGNVSMSALASYAESKRMAEYLTAAYCTEHKLNVSVVRLFSTYGSTMNLNRKTVFADLFNQAISSDKIIINGNGRGIRNWGYIEDVIFGLLTVLFKGNTGEAYNIGSEEDNYSILEFAKLLNKVMGNQKQIIVRDKENNALIKDSIQIPDLSKLVALGWHSKVNLEKGLSLMIYNK